MPGGRIMNRQGEQCNFSPFINPAAQRLCPMFTIGAPYGLYGVSIA